MLVNGHSTNGHKRNGVPRGDLMDRITSLEGEYLTKRKGRDAESSYLAGESDRMNPVPKGINPLGTDADYHYRTSHNYYLMVERGRAAVRNHPLVEQGINRLIANLKLGQNTIDIDSGDLSVDDDLTADWQGWCNDASRCDYEQTRTFQQIDRQSFFSQVADGDILHLPLKQGSLQTIESHHIRTPYGHIPTGQSVNGIVHGVEVNNGRTVAYHITPHNLLYFQALAMKNQTQRIPAFDAAGNKTAFWLGFTHRFYQRRGVSRLSPPRDAMNGFDDLNYANIKSSLRRALISYLMQSTQPQQAQTPFGGAKIPQAGSRYAANDVGLGLESIIVEQLGEPAQVFKSPEGYSIDGWNANLPAPAFFEHSALLLTMLAVNLDLPLMFLLLDGSLVNFHGGRMTFDQAKMRFRQLQRDRIDGLWNPTYAWRIRRKLTPGSPDFDAALYAVVNRGKVNPLNFCFHPPAWEYVKPMEDVTAEKLADTSNLRSLRQIMGDRGEDFDKRMPEIIFDRKLTWIEALSAAAELQSQFSGANIDQLIMAEKLIYPDSVKMSVLVQASDEAATAAASKDKKAGNNGD
jgi:hypothetical protein